MPAVWLSFTAGEVTPRMPAGTRALRARSHSASARDQLVAGIAIIAIRHDDELEFEHQPAIRPTNRLAR